MNLDPAGMKREKCLVAATQHVCQLRTWCMHLDAPSRDRILPEQPVAVVDE